jgi:amino acid transporter
MTLIDLVLEYQVPVAFFVFLCAVAGVVALKADRLNHDWFWNEGFEFKASPQAGIVFCLCVVLLAIFLQDGELAGR